MEITGTNLDMMLNDIKREQVILLHINDSKDQEYDLKYGALINSICVSINNIKKLRQTKFKLRK